jgi:hypothetical protein
VRGDLGCDIQMVAQGAGCKLVSPWPMPMALWPVRLKDPGDTKLYWSVYDEQNGWSEKEGTVTLAGPVG